MVKFIQINICSTSLYFIHFSFTSYFRPHQGCCSRASPRRRPEAMQGGFQGLPKAHVFDKGHNHHNHHNPWGVAGGKMWKDVESYGITGATAPTPSIMSCESLEPMEVQLNPRNHECSIPRQPMTHFRPE